VIGTAPVAADGSAHFKVPTGVPIYFQALDENGLAVQSMRSATYVHPGERLSCVGCHEPKQQTPAFTPGTPLAWQQAPAILQPETADASPISFPRLVQPVLDKHCTSCHAEPDSIAAGASDLSGRLTGPNGWSVAFTSLKSYAWAHNGGNGIIFKEGSRSEAGKVGTRASRLLPYLKPGHHEVRLDSEEMRRITLWLDCNSNFYGAYHALQAQGEGQDIAPAVR
jgi:Hydrazine synthase alpha subunit middle domain